MQRRNGLSSNSRIDAWSIELVALILCSFLLATSCSHIERPAVKPYLAETAAPKLQEIRWSNGRAPKHLDPALAAASPETDIVRAMYEGLTEIDPRTLDAIPGVAESWTANDDHRVWTFVIRSNAKWSNGRRINSADFVRSFKRLAAVGVRGAHRGLLSNIVGFSDMDAAKLPEAPEIDKIMSTGQLTPVEPNLQFQKPTTGTAQIPAPEIAAPSSPMTSKLPDVSFGVVAKDADTLEVRLRRPDANLPKLLANPIFMPIYGDGKGLDDSKPNVETVTNGPFKLVKAADGRLELERSETYWDSISVKLDRLVFVEQQNPDQAFDAYKKGQIDIVTNSDFEPLALKLMTPFKDFRRTTHGALNFYQVNTAVPPFNDRRVREALALAIEREQIVDAELRGSAEPANRFLPLGKTTEPSLSFNAERAKQLLELAGFPNGSGFPTIRLVVNRNDLQQRVARAVAKTWKQYLNVETDLLIKDNAEIAAIRKSGEYDLIRRGVVLPSADETMSLAAILGYDKMVIPQPSVERTPLDIVSPESVLQRTGPNSADPKDTVPDSMLTAQPESSPAEKLFSEDDALYDMRAIPIYFPTSYSLVKPYVLGFETNGLDAPLLKAIAIDTEWSGSSNITE